MKLARLELFGFKSFLNRTVFHFKDGVTSIVGPNGCGKSNIVDAIVWALGERGTKSLRIKEMGDVIFHGSNGKRPVNIAEVSVAISNAERELTVKRRIYRDGVNEYYMDGASVRLKDVQDFFLGTGVGLNAYAIVEQGKIDSFVLMKPQERRVIIEEASGVTRFEEKKRDAIIRMEEVAANLERVEDIRVEVAKSFEKAENEWDRWKAYKVLAEKLREIDKEILLRGYAEISKKIRKIEEKHEGIDEELRRKEEERGKTGEALHAKEAEFSLTDSVIRKLEIDIKAKEKDMENRVLEMTYVSEEKKRLEEECAAFIGNIMDLKKEREKTTEYLKTLRREKGQHVASLEEEEEKANRLKTDIEELKTGIGIYEKQIEEERVQFFVSVSRLADIKNQISETERLNRERDKKEERRRAELAKSDVRGAELEKELNSLKRGLEQIAQEKASLASKETDARKRKEEFTKTIEEKKRIIETLRAEHRMKEQFLSRMKVQKGAVGENPAGIRKLIDLIKVESDKELALERFFAREMGYYVLPEVDPKGMSEMAKRHDGNYIFFPEKGIFRLRDQGIELDVKWVDTVEDAFTRISEGEEGIFIHDEALVDSRGYVLYEKDTKVAQLKEFRERKRLEKELEGIDVKIREDTNSLADALRLFENSERIHRDLRKELDEKETFISRAERQMLILEAELRSLKERLKELQSRTDLVDEIPVSVVEDLLKEKTVRESEKETRERKMASLGEELGGVKKVCEETLSQWHEMTIHLERKGSLLKRLDEDETRTGILLETRAKEIAAIEEKVRQIIGRIKECFGKIQELERNYEHIQQGSGKDIERYEELKAVSGNLHMEIQALRENLAGIQRDIERRKSKKESLETEMAVFLEKKETIYERLKTTYNIDFPENTPLNYSIDPDAEREEVSKAIAQMGDVNFRAEKEYSEIKERLVFLETQKADLETAMESLKKTIGKIDSLSKEIFFETLETVNDAFSRFAQTLFKGGHGYLALDKASGGVEIYVQPSGKRVLRMEQLSGGEKALISLAFLLALMDTKPSPFSILDEIDAPLDDANLFSLMEIIKDISRKTQIVFITHNRITMEASDIVYGITMEQEGISKVVSVRL